MPKNLNGFNTILCSAKPQPSHRRRKAAAISRAPAEVLEFRQLLSAAPPRPVISEPELNSLIISWSENNANDTYELWANNLTTGQSGFIQANDLNRPAYLLSRRRREEKLRIWVRAMNDQGRSPWSAPVDLVLSRHTAAPDTATLLSPQTTESGEPIKFTWQTSSHATRHELWVRNLTTGTAAVIHETNLSGREFATTESLPTGRYRAWLRAHNAIGTSSWSDPLTFHVIDVTSPPARPEFRAPQRVGRLEWHSVMFADSYEVWANNLTTGESRALHSDAQESNVYSPGRRIDPGLYRFWVRARNEAGVSTWSRPYDYVFSTVADQAPNAPRSIAAEVSDADGKVTLKWQDGHVDGQDDFADYFEVWVNNSSQQRVLYGRNLQSSTLTSETPLPNGRYHVWLRASNAYGRSQWTSVHSFDVNLPASPPRAPSIQSISFGDSDELQVTWSAVQQAASYEVNLQNDDTGADWTWVVDGEQSHLTVFASRRSNVGINYTLRVRAVNLAGPGGWSALRRFSSESNYIGGRVSNRGGRPGGRS